MLTYTPDVVLMQAIRYLPLKVLTRDVLFSAVIVQCPRVVCLQNCVLINEYETNMNKKNDVNDDNDLSSSERKRPLTLTLSVTREHVCAFVLSVSGVFTSHRPPAPEADWRTKAGGETHSSARARPFIGAREEMWTFNCSDEKSPSGGGDVSRSHRVTFNHNEQFNAESLPPRMSFYTCCPITRQRSGRRLINEPASASGSSRFQLKEAVGNEMKWLHTDVRKGQEMAGNNAASKKKKERRMNRKETQAQTVKERQRDTNQRQRGGKTAANDAKQCPKRSK
ncbi:hypothetical protein JOB18_019343 [Solea senegalensis]|uniref:Small EDRK-rich factor-like N-terminal domain-containing protein n=1 Tax=Solea senegalensis TaxID=28829 RepID=A0AAV6PZS9_SOLSE|nr:hypothetical protein JOB18_019343 [Solea senegalensis]